MAQAKHGIHEVGNSGSQNNVIVSEFFMHCIVKGKTLDSVFDTWSSYVDKWLS